MKYKCVSCGKPTEEPKKGRLPRCYTCSINEIRGINLLWSVELSANQNLN
jgi:hypothetical protein